MNPIDSLRRTTQQLSIAELETHADVRCILGQLALFLDRGFTLRREPREDATTDQKKRYDEDIRNGKFVKYDNIWQWKTLKRLARLAKRYSRIYANV